MNDQAISDFESGLDSMAGIFMARLNKKYEMTESEYGEMREEILNMLKTANQGYLKEITGAAYRKWQQAGCKELLSSFTTREIYERMSKKLATK